MQRKSERRSNVARSEATRADLLEAARKLFVEKGFAETSTPEIVAAASVTRGALYHHFGDKLGLFRAVVEAEANEAAKAIRAAAADASEPIDALIKGGEAYLAALAPSGRARLLLVEAQAVLGHTAMAEIDARSGGATLVEGLTAALPAEAEAPIDALAEILSGAFERAALAIANGGSPEAYRAALETVLHGLVESAVNAKDATQT